MEGRASAKSAPMLGKMAIVEVTVIPSQEALSVSDVSRRLERVEVIFDDPTLVVSTGPIMLAA